MQLSFLFAFFVVNDLKVQIISDTVDAGLCSAYAWGLCSAYSQFFDCSEQSPEPTQGCPFEAAGPPLAKNLPCKREIFLYFVGVL